jgi:hypothetical protein
LSPCLSWTTTSTWTLELKLLVELLCFDEVAEKVVAAPPKG